MERRVIFLQCIKFYYFYEVLLNRFAMPFVQVRRGCLNWVFGNIFRF